MATSLDGTLDLLAEMRATPHAARGARLGRLPRETLEWLAAAALRQWERERERLEDELAARRVVIESLERGLREARP
jgi:hypothetical protein